MTGFKGFFALFFLLAFVVPCSAKQYPYEMNCELGKAVIQSKRAYGFTITLEPVNRRCHLAIFDKQKTVIFEAASDGIGVLVSDKFDEHRQPSAIVQTSFPSLEVSYRVFVVSLGDRPGLVGQIENTYGFWLQDDCDDHRLHIWTADGAFQGDEELLKIYRYDLFVPNDVESSSMTFILGR